MKKVLLILLLVFSVALVGCQNKESKNDLKEENEVVPSDYMFYFVGEINKTKYMTYIYKIDNNQDNYGFKYVNTIINDDEEEIVGKGEVSWTDDVFIVAKKHGAYSYVQYRGLDNRYTIDEFQVRFLMN